MIVTKTPDLPINGTAFISRWVAAYNPIVFLFQKDVDTPSENYKVSIEITTDTDTKLVYSASASPAGVVRADLSAYLSALVSTSVRFKKFSLKAVESWEGSLAPAFSSVASIGTYYATYSAMQLGDQNGGNMAKYVGFQNVLAEWMTSFREPSYFVGLPFELSYIKSEYIETKSMRYRATYLNVNKAAISNESVLTSVSPAGVISFDFSLLTVPVSAYYVKIQAYYLESSLDQFITKPIIIKIVRPCESDPYVYLKWTDTVGGYNYFRFGYRQGRSINVSNETVISRNIFNWATDNSIFDVVKKSGNKKLVFGANNMTEVAAMESLETSIKVAMFTGSVFQTIELIPGTFDNGDTRRSSFPVKFSINLPDINIQRQ